MNINDFNSPEEYPVDLLADIFQKQRELAEKYHPIEKENGFLVGDSLRVNIHDKFGQHRIKDFAWRVTEELMEAKEAHDYGDSDHCQEELADALHFMVELCIICGIKSESLRFELPTWIHNFDRDILNVVYHLGLACNCLKNKPWKQTQMLTDVLKFEDNIYWVFFYLMGSFNSAGIKDEEEIYDLYFRKNKVNQFRQESKY